MAIKADYKSTCFLTTYATPGNVIFTDLFSSKSTKRKTNNGRTVSKSFLKAHVWEPSSSKT